MNERLEQSKFDAEVLFSILSDAINILFRDRLRPVSLEDEAEHRWRVDCIWKYMPTANVLLPLESLTLRAARPGESSRVVLEIPRPALRRLVSQFLRDALSLARESGIEPTGRWPDSEVESAIRYVEERIVELWDWVGFN
jgi:hypothetical protein